MPFSMTVLQSMKLGIDVNRHKEIIVKAVSAILLLLLKHFKLNHIYQFEFMSQHLVFANCIPLILKFLNQNLVAYTEAKNVYVLINIALSSFFFFFFKFSCIKKNMLFLSTAFLSWISLLMLSVSNRS